MNTLEAKSSTLLVIDLQARLVPALEGGETAVENTRRLLEAARMLDIPALFTEQNPSRLGPTVPELTQLTRTAAASAMPKMTFSALRTSGIATALNGHGGDRAIVIAGCEAHVCVLQSALDLLGEGRAVFVVIDAVASRRAASKDAALARLARHGAELITAEMAIFEWLGTAEHPKFKELSALIK